MLILWYNNRNSTGLSMFPLACSSALKPDGFLAHPHSAPIGSDSTPLFSVASALFSVMARTQTTYFQWLAHSFPSHGGGGDTWSGALALSFPFPKLFRSLKGSRTKQATQRVVGLASCSLSRDARPLGQLA